MAPMGTRLAERKNPLSGARSSGSIWTVAEMLTDTDFVGLALHDRVIYPVRDRPDGLRLLLTLSD